MQDKQIIDLEKLVSLLEERAKIIRELKYRLRRQTSEFVTDVWLSSDEFARILNKNSNDVFMDFQGYGFKAKVKENETHYALKDVIEYLKITIQHCFGFKD